MLGSGGVLAAKAKTAVGEMEEGDTEGLDNETGPGGILLNTVYSVIDARTVEDGRCDLSQAHSA